MNKGTYYFPRNRTYQPPLNTGGGNTTTGSFCLPTYTNINITGSDYTIPGEGVYLISDNDATHNMIFPDPVTNNGHSIIIIPPSSTSVFTSGSIYNWGGVISYGRMYSFVAVSGSWIAEYLVP